MKNLDMPLVIQCRLIRHDEDITHNSSPSPWILDPKAHTPAAPRLGHDHFCKCIWARLVPGPSVYDYRADTFTPVWTPIANTYLSTLWFFSSLHTSSHGVWTSNHYAECLSILLNQRVSQFDFFTRVRFMRTTLPECWVPASMMTAASKEVVSVFEKLNAKWEVFVKRFDMWGDAPRMMGGLGRVEPVLQWGRVVEVNADVYRFAETGEEQPGYIDECLKWWIGQ